MIKSKITCATLLFIMLFSVLTPCMATKPVITQYQSPYDNVHTVPEEFKNGPFTMIYDSPEGIHIDIYDKPPQKLPEGSFPKNDPVIGYIYIQNPMVILIFGILLLLKGMMNTICIYRLVQGLLVFLRRGLSMSVGLMGILEKNV